MARSLVLMPVVASFAALITLNSPVSSQPAKPKREAVKVDPELAAIGCGELLLHDEPASSTLANFKSQLKRETRDIVTDALIRSINIDYGATGKSTIRQVTFYPSPYPVLSATIRFSEPKK